MAVALVDPTSAADTDVLFTGNSRSNVVADPLLNRISRKNEGWLDPVSTDGDLPVCRGAEHPSW